MKFPSRLTLLLFCVIITSCSGKTTITPDTDLTAETKRYTDALSPPAWFEGEPEMILHRAGAYQEYAKNINCSEFGSGVPPADITSLMDIAFTKYKADSIEIDLRTIPGSAVWDDVYVVHDYIEPEYTGTDFPAVRSYLSKNSIDKIILHFYAGEYGKAGKKIYLELKLPRKDFFSNNTPLDSDEKTYIKRCVDAVQQALPPSTKDSADVNNLFRSIEFVSFNYYALQEIHRLSAEENAQPFRLHFLAATNRAVAGRYALMRDRELNYLNDELLSRLASAPWLSGIWFDPRGIDGAASVWNSVNRKRLLSGMTLCGIYIFVYGMEFGALAEKIREMDYSGSSPHGLENIRGLCFEMQTFADGNKSASCD